MTHYWITWFPGVLLAAGGVFTLVWKSFTYLVHARDALERLEKEFQPNGGASMRDQLNRLESRQKKGQMKQQQWNKKHSADDSERFGRIERAIKKKH